MALTAAGATWPVVPAATLLIGLTGLLSVALRPAKASGTGGFGAAGTGSPLPLTTGLTVVHAAISILMVVAGFAGLLPTHGSTLAALGATLIAGAVSGVAARHLPARVTGWLTAVAASLGVAFTAGRAVELPLPITAFAVLGAAASALALGATLSYRGLHPAHRDTVHPSAADPNVAGPSAAHVTTAWPSAGRSDSAQRITAPRRLEARAVQAAAHAGAVLALLLTWGSARHAAVVCTLWGVALGLRALLPGERATVRRLLVVAAATTELSGWWLLIAAAQVSTLEAYTLPAAAVALLAGWLGLRSRPSLGSWTALGPALAAALLPTLASVLVGEGQPIRRLLLGLGALAVVLAGAQTRRRAPVITGGAVLAIVALHELILVWDLLPRWIPLAAGGLLLVGLAMTVERRRRDLSRVRAALTRMS
jgi:hypothetical protein